LAQTDDLRVLDALLPLLRNPARAWAAHALLAKLTRVDEKEVDVWQARVGGWWESFGNRAFARWSHWLAENRANLRWDPNEKYFAHRP
jgi:hypothetical protein